MAVKRNAALGFIFITILIDAIGIGIIIPIVPDLIKNLTGENLSHASTYSGWLTFAYASMQFLFAPIAGGLSDRYGRRPILLASLLGLGIDYLFLAFAPTLAWLFVGRVIAGIFGASFTTAVAYIADISTPEKRAQNFGLVGAAFGLGFIIGPAIGGILGQHSLHLPFIVAAVFSLVNTLYGFFILPESLLPENRRPFDIKRANPFGALTQLKKYPALSGMVVSIVLIYISGHATQSTWTFITMEKYNWDKNYTGYSLSFVGLMIALVQGGLIRILIPKFGQTKSVNIGMMFYIIGFTLFAFASQGWMMYAFMPIFALGGIAGPAIQGIMSNQVPPNEQGELQGSLTALMSITSIFGPLIMTGLFTYCTSPTSPIYFPGAPFALGAVLVLVSLLLAQKSLKKYGMDHPKSK
ncbi:TCR/Tet family MFS transporter [Chitinophaga skermanii]|nr:TCR/Tet family MFS transporter [Chitinophaga skermanii]